MNGISAVISNTMELAPSPAPRHVSTQQQGGHLETRTGLSPEPNHAGTPMSYFLASRTERNKRVLLQPLSL